MVRYRASDSHVNRTEARRSLFEAALLQSSCLLPRPSRKTVKRRLGERMAVEAVVDRIMYRATVIKTEGVVVMSRCMAGKG